jgi:hypothetical protein
MRVMRILFVTWLAAGAADGAHDPRPSPTSCPLVTVSCVDTGMYGEPVTFTANLTGGDAAVAPTFKWTVPGFRILGGQGTSA